MQEVLCVVQHAAPANRPVTCYGLNWLIRRIKAGRPQVRLPEQENPRSDCRCVLLRESKNIAEVFLKVFDCVVLGLQPQTLLGLLFKDDEASLVDALCSC